MDVDGRYIELVGFLHQNSHTHMLHLWNIYQHSPINEANVGQFIIHGAYIYIYIWNFAKNRDILIYTPKSSQILFISSLINPWCGVAGDQLPRPHRSTRRRCPAAARRSWRLRRARCRWRPRCSPRRWGAPGPGPQNAGRKNKENPAAKMMYFLRWNPKIMWNFGGFDGVEWWIHMNLSGWGKKMVIRSAI